MDYHSSINHAKRSGMEEKQQEIAGNVIQEGADIQFVSKTTGLTEDELIKLQAQLPIPSPS